MRLSKDEHARLDESLKTLQKLFNSQVERIKKPKAGKIDNEFLRTIGEKYLSVTGLLDLLEDFEMMTKQECTCAGPCKASCVSPCASRCNASTYDACHGENM